MPHPDFPNSATFKAAERGLSRNRGTPVPVADDPDGAEAKSDAPKSSDGETQT